MTAQNSEYWNTFYKTRETNFLDIPSQFAVFFLNEISRDTPIIEIGCGTGRDSLFFASRGSKVIGVDGSISAVELCRSKAQTFGYDNASFICSDVSDPALAEKVAIAGASPAIYARFFLHAIDEAAEAAFLKMASSVVGNGVIAVEFRTDRDEQQTKVTPTHYRRFISPISLLTRAAKHGLSPIYFTEGFGFAKYKNDDAHVARVILQKSAA